MDNLIYLDASFIAAKFEEITGVTGEAQFAKTEGGKADIGFSFAKAGVHTQETVTFKKSSTGMLRELETELKAIYPISDLSTFSNYSGTKFLWVDGILSIQAWASSDDPQTRFDYYGLKVSGRRLALISEPTYFASGFAQVVNASDALVGYVGIPVRALVRVLWHIETSGEFVAVPMIVLECET